VIDIKELSYQESQKFISAFDTLEESLYISHTDRNFSDWVDVEEVRARYIWLVEDMEKPLGFLSYRVLILPNKIDFIYIVKIYVLKSHREENPILVEEERVSEILFREIDRRNVNILTLESACKKLDRYYESLGFEYNKEISDIFAQEIKTTEQIMYRKKKDIEINLSDEEKKMFGNRI